MFAVSIRVLSLLLALTFSAGAQAQSLPTGNLRGTDYFSKLSIQPWGNGQYIVRGNVRYANKGIPFEAVVSGNGNGSYSGSGRVNAFYSSGRKCYYDMSLNISTDGRRVYIHSRQPARIVMESRGYDPARYCPPYRSVVHARPYYR